jgi:4-hydroxybenzoate polyprenyltransferase
MQTAAIPLPEVSTQSWPGVIARLLRVHQWSKNLLVFAPVVTSHQVLSAPVLKASAVMFVVFCCAASATYIANDLMDLESDRQHPTKRFRPLASGRIPPRTARIIASFLLLAVGLIVTAYPFPTAAAKVFPAAYLLCTFFYSAWLKRVALLDVVILAFLYALRVLAGGAATGIVISAWTIAFFLFLFLSLALLKRYAELANAPTDTDWTPGRDYRRADMPFLSQCGVASGLISVLVLALYIHSPEVHPLYKRPELLWLLGPLLAYGILKLWLAGHRGLMHDDPIVFVVQSRWTYGLATVIAAVLIAASI